MKWINTPNLKALDVHFEGTTLTFTDLTNNESVIVQQADTHPSFWIVNNQSPQPVRYRKGKGTYRRDVYHYATKGNATWLRAGLTVHSGPFSSLPHPFELHPEPGFEEVFALRTMGTGLLEGHGLWSDGTKASGAWRFTGVALACVPMGWHRVVSLPNPDGHIPALSYIWAYLSKTPNWEKE